MNQVKCKTEIQMPQFSPFYKFCPFCEKPLTEAQKTIFQDKANQVRECLSCDTAWVWEAYRLYYDD